VFEKKHKGTVETPTYDGYENSMCPHTGHSRHTAFEIAGVKEVQNTLSKDRAP